MRLLGRDDKQYYLTLLVERSWYLVNAETTANEWALSTAILSTVLRVGGKAN
jgi:hypothetical protein